MGNSTGFHIMHPKYEKSTVDNRRMLREKLDIGRFIQRERAQCARSFTHQARPAKAEKPKSTGKPTDLWRKIIEEQTAAAVKASKQSPQAKPAKSAPTTKPVGKP